MPQITSDYSYMTAIKMLSNYFNRSMTKYDYIIQIRELIEILEKGPRTFGWEIEDEYEFELNRPRALSPRRFQVNGHDLHQLHLEIGQMLNDYVKLSDGSLDEIEELIDKLEQSIEQVELTEYSELVVNGHYLMQLHNKARKQLNRYLNMLCNQISF